MSRLALALAVACFGHVAALASTATGAFDLTADVLGATTCTSSSSTEPAPGLFFLDDVVDPAAMAELQTAFNATMHHAPVVEGRRTMAVPAGVAARLTAALVHRRRLDLDHHDAAAAAAAAAAALELPVNVRHDSFANHKDTYHVARAHEPRVVVDGQVGVLYLGGDGRMVFTRDATGQETSIQIKANRFIAWDNANFTHRVEQPAGGMPRQILGPLTWGEATQKSGGLVGVCGGTVQCPSYAGYACSDGTYVLASGTFTDSVLCESALGSPQPAFSNTTT